MQIKYKYSSPHLSIIHKLTRYAYRVRTLTGKEIELDIEPDYKVRPPPMQERLRPSRHVEPTHSRTQIAHKHSQKQVQRIKERVEEKEGIPPQQQRLIYGGKQM